MPHLAAVQSPTASGEAVMKAVLFDHEDPEFGASLVDIDEPDLPNGE